ncbi:MAG: hypothetical protein QOI70_1133 [Microbacteriaceae bacterium]|jgi:hypothetical protein|nr:hypothetical protein [Microbacteriaceae bacterium]
MANFPPDRFESVHDDLYRTGAHRLAPGRGRGWITFAWAALATIVLVGIGVFGLSVVRGNVGLPFASSANATPTPTPSPTPTVTPKLNATLPITILNGTTTPQLANNTGDYLVSKGWGGASAALGARSNTATPNITKTVVYYSDPANEAAAMALVQSLKVGTISLSNAFPDSKVTVVLGADFVLPKG